MKIETLIAKIQTHTGGNIPPDIMEAVMGLVSRLEGMLPDIETARKVATSLGIMWDREPRNATLAWAWTVWPAFDAGRIADLGATVLPLLPVGQPFGQDEIDTAHGRMLVAEAEGDTAGAEDARTSARRMRAHNLRLD